MEDDLLHNHPWLALDGPSLAGVAAGLQLLPENIEMLNRLQRLTAIGCALPVRSGAQPLSPSKLRNLTKDQTVSGEGIRRMEDPYADFYSAEIAFVGGPHLVLQGLTDRSAHTLQLLLDTIFGDEDHVLSNVFPSMAAPLIAGFLSLSDEVCRRSGILRGLAPLDRKPKEVFVPGQKQLDMLRAAVTFSDEDLNAKLSSSSQLSVFEHSLSPGARIPVPRMGMEDQLILTPFMKMGEGLIVVSPGEIAASLRHQLIVLSQKLDCHDELAGLFRRQVLNEAAHVIRMLGAEAMGAVEASSDRLMIRQRFSLTEGKYIDLIVLSDDLSNYSAENPYGTWEIKDLSVRVIDFLNSPERSISEESQTLKLVIFQGLGRAIFLGLPEQVTGGPILILTLDELRVMVDLEKSDPLFLWRFAKSYEKFRVTTEVRAWETLDKFAVYRNREQSFYLNDDRKPHLLALAVGTGFPLRIEAMKKYDRHVALSPRGPYYVLVAALYGLGTAPIYLTYAFDDIPDLLVEFQDLKIWVGSSDQVRHELIITVCNYLEAAAYWLWKIADRYPDLVRNAMSTDGDLYVEIILAEPDAWIASFTQNDNSPNPKDWVLIKDRRFGSFAVEIHAGGLKSVVSDNNEADRALVSALLGHLTREASTASAELVSLVDGIAPVGNKKILRVVTSDQVLMREGHLPPPRYLQPSMSAFVLDELADWLRAQGFEVGPISDEDRTGVLGLIVNHHFEELAEIVSKLSSVGLIEYLMIQDEALIHNEEKHWRNLPYQIACYGGESSLVRELMGKQSRHVIATVACRFLIEYISANFPQGQQPITLDCYDRLLALAAEIVERGTLSDAIYHGLSISKLEILESGRFGVNREDRYHVGTVEQMLWFAAAKGRSITNLDVSTSPISVTEPLDISEVDRGMMVEFGFTLSDLALGIGEMVALGDQRQLVEPFEMPLDEVRTHLSNALSWSKEMTMAFIQGLTLEPVSDFSSIGADRYPWRYNRDRSYIRRPLILRRKEGEKSNLIWGARRLWTSGRYWVELIYGARLRANTLEMRTVLGRIRQRQNENFEQDVSRVILAAGFTHSLVRVKKLNGQKLKSRDGSDLGDIDVLGINLNNRAILLVEAKDLELARTPAELAHEAESLFSGASSAQVRLEQRTTWVREHLRDVLVHLKIDMPTKHWSVRSVVVMSNNHLTPRVIESGTSFVVIDELSDWLSTEFSVRMNEQGSRPKK